MSDDENYNRMSIEELIERSSLGTPAAKAIRARYPLWVRDQVLARVREPGAAGIPPAQGSGPGKAYLPPRERYSPVRMPSQTTGQRAWETVSPCTSQDITRRAWS
jgi:hypothetical protein